MRDPDSTRNFFPNEEANIEMYDKYVEDGTAYLTEAISHTEAQPNLEAPWRDGGEPLQSLKEEELLFIQDYNNNYIDDEEYGLLDLGGGYKRDDESIARRKELKRKEELERANKPPP